MRTLEIGTKKYTEVDVMDERGQGNANHEYRITSVCPPEQDCAILGTVSFQNGPIKEFGVNGIMNEDLIAIVIDRMRGFQSGDFACKNNEQALDSLELALAYLRARTNERETRGVEGTNVI